jgi:serine/threonine-protein kinase
MTGKKIGNYTLTRELGKGGMANVYKAVHLHNQHTVAIKVLNNELVHNEHIRKRFLAEAKNMRKMNHPHIVKVLDTIDEGSTVAFAMELVDGETLKECIERKRLSKKEVLSFMKQMLEALGYVHDQQLIHRDIKPSNFMVDKSGNVKLMDFGIAKNTNANAAEYTQTGTGVTMGTPMYMSPEQVKATKEVEASSDIYSMGAVLWQMVTGKKPYDANDLSVPEMQYAILKESLPSTHTSWDPIIQKATAKDAHLRFYSCRKFWEALSNVDASNQAATDDSTVVAALQDTDTKAIVRGSENASVSNVSTSQFNVPAAYFLQFFLGLGYFYSGISRKKSVVYLVCIAYAWGAFFNGVLVYLGRGKLGFSEGRFASVSSIEMFLFHRTGVGLISVLACLFIGHVVGTLEFHQARKKSNAK